MSTGQIAGGVVGAVVGAFFSVGNPAAILQGAAIGASLGGMLDPPKGPTVHGPRLSDLAVQTSTYGNFIPRVYGTIGIHGNLLWLENNQLKETVRKKKQGGKGGGSSTTVKTYSYSATFILALCQGPIAGIRRIWCMDKLIYNAGSDDLETIIASNQAAKGWKLYLGTDDQMPDPRYEADVGVGNASAFRGIAYLAFYDFQLADYSNTLQAAQFKVEVMTEQSVTQIVEISRVQIPEGAVNYPGNGVLISESGYGYLATSVNDPLIYRVTEAGAVLVADLSTGGWDLATSTSTNSQISVTSIEPSWAAWSGGVTKINGTNYSVSASLARRLAIAPNGDIYGSTSSAGPVQITKIAASGNVLVYSANIEPSFLRFVQSILADNTHVYVFTAQSSGGGSIITKLEISDNQLLFDSEATGTHFSGQLSASDGGDYIYLSNGLISASDVRIITIRKSDLSVVGTDTYPKALNNAASSTLLRQYNRTVSGLLSTLTHENGINELVTYKINHVQASEVPLSEIIEAEVSLTSLLGATDIDVSLLADSVRGYRVSGGTIRAAIEPLQGAFPFDVIQSGYQIKCVPRGQASVATIPWEDLGATDGDEPGDILRQSREMDSQLPASTTVTVLDAAREYSVLPQTASRVGTEAVNRVDRELPLVLTADETAGVAEVLQGLAWLERSDLSFTLPPPYLALEPSDVVTVPTPQATYQLRLTEINYTPDGRLECKAKPNRAALYTPNATGGEGVPPVGTVTLPGESLFVPLDIPVVDETIQNDLGFVGVMTGYNSGWPGGLLVRSNDDGQTWLDLQGFTGKASIGRARGTLPASSGTLIDQRTLTVDMISGEPESVTHDQMLSGINYAAYGVDGRWEIVRFQNAPLQADGSHLISGFVRGERGTEWATGLHAAGDYFILLDDPDNAFIGSPVESIGLSRLYRGVTSGASVDDSTDVAFAYQGVNLECLSPVYAKGSRDGSSNFAGTFTRRSRLSSSWWTTGVVAPVGESSESYEIDVMNASVVVRTITTGTPTFAYSAANQTTDFGSPQSSITFRIYQLSETVGRGYPLEVTL